MIKTEKRSYIWNFLVLILCCVAIISLISKCNCIPQFERGLEIEDNVLKVKEVLVPLNVAQDGTYPNSVLQYFEYYGLNFDYEAGKSCEHIFGTFQSDNNILVGHIFRPKEYKATIFVLHGYLKHCGQMNHLICFLLQQGYAIAAYDLPGHGLSSGERGIIDDFSEYSHSLRNFINVVSDQLNEPYHFIGHSTGGAIVLDYLLTTEESSFEKVILVAPLVRHSLSKFLKIGYLLSSPFTTNFPRRFRSNSSDKEFLNFIKTKDPLQVRIIPLKWVKAMLEWNDRIANYKSCDKTVKIIQGTDDMTVDWKFNVKFICKKFDNVEVSLINKGQHELFNESADIRMEVFSQVSKYLGDK